LSEIRNLNLFFAFFSSATLSLSYFLASQKFNNCTVYYVWHLCSFEQEQHQYVENVPEDVCPCGTPVKIALPVHTLSYSTSAEQIFMKFGIGESTENCEATLVFV